MKAVQAVVKAVPGNEKLSIGKKSTVAERRIKF